MGLDGVEIFTNASGSLMRWPIVWRHMTSYVTSDYIFFSSHIAMGLDGVEIFTNASRSLMRWPIV